MHIRLHVKIMLVLGTFIFLFLACKESSSIPSSEINPDLSTFKIEISTAADQHFKTWFPKIIDTINGGYYTNFEYDWKMSDQQEKMLVTQARALWAASIASQYYPHDSTFKIAADHGFAFLTNQMWDEVNGGFYLNYPKTHSGEISYKLLYGNAFALYALAEYAKINDSKKVIKWIEKTFQWMDFKARRPGESGYYNIITDTSQDKNSAAYLKFAGSIGWGNPDWKDQNTSIHLLEAFTNAYVVWPDERLKLRLEEMLLIVRDKMVNEKNGLNLYFDQDFKPITFVDESRETILKNINLDHISFGHNIETSFLMIDAARILYDTIDTLTMKVATALLDHTIAHGFGPNYTGIYDKAYQFKGSDTLEIVANQKTWWAQAEALHTLVLFSSLLPERKTEFMNIAIKLWGYMKQNIIDSEHGGWYGNGLDNNPESKTERKAHPWKGPYHDGRALLFCKMYLQ
ncbi:MAG TPA: AGE family epimerase/isomerase [Saprospiraceae bacterium]|nr:AGE family epimerase/isomerase [Saprospiraceae bacterium]